MTKTTSPVLIITLSIILVPKISAVGFVSATLAYEIFTNVPGVVDANCSSQLVGLSLNPNSFHGYKSGREVGTTPDTVE